MSSRLLTLRLEPNRATLSDAKGILATLDGEHIILQRATLVPYANKQRWRRQDLNSPRELAKFISHVCACPLANFTSMATGRTRWSVSEFSIVKGLPRLPVRGPLEVMGDELLKEGYEKTIWRGLCIYASGVPTRLRAMVFVERYGLGGGIVGGKSFGWLATVRP
jgi:hypothetical protein